MENSCRISSSRQNLKKLNFLQNYGNNKIGSSWWLVINISNEFKFASDECILVSVVTDISFKFWPICKFEGIVCLIKKTWVKNVLSLNGQFYKEDIDGTLSWNFELEWKIQRK